MFADLIRRLTAPAPDQLPDTDARLALGALLVRLARADGDYAAVEIARIDATLAKRYGLADPAPLRAQCEVLESEAPDTVRFTRAIKAAVAYEDRRAVIAAMWEIVLADGARDANENALMRQFGALLHVPDREIGLARQRVIARKG